MNRPVAALQQRRRHLAARPLLTGIGIALGLILVSASPARASTYRVYTSSAANSMTLNAGDGFCSLAEAVEHAKGNAIYGCTDFASGSAEQRIELLESAGKPFASNHFRITTLTLNRQGIRIRIFGSGGFIDSTATASAFVIPFKSIGFFERVTLTNTAGSAGGRLVENYGELGFYGVTFTKGDVTGNQHSTGRGGAIFNGITQGMFPAFISSAGNSVITGNKAKKGGGIYNDFGKINDLAITISGNSSTGEGGGIYNNAGVITSSSVSVSSNTGTAGGGIYNNAGTITGSSVTISSNTATLAGGGIHNNAGIISGSSVTISSNKATLAGGGIYNVSTSPPPNLPTNGTITFSSATIQGNSARTGGGVFNRGMVYLDGSTITGNFTTTTGNSGETCTFSDPDNTKPGVFATCNGSGGGVLSVHKDGGSVTRFDLTNSTISNNTASARGAAIFSVGVLQVKSNAMNNNRAQDGSALYVVGPKDGTQQYCEITGTAALPSRIHCNSTTTAGTGYSIVAGGSQGMFKCLFTDVTSGGNSFPRCQTGAFDSVNSSCPAQVNVSCPQP